MAVQHLPSPPSAPVAAPSFPWHWMLPLIAGAIGAFLCLGCSSATPTMTHEELAAGLTWEGRETSLAEIELGRFEVSRAVSDHQMLLVRVSFVGLADPDHLPDVHAAVARAPQRLQEALRTLVASTEPAVLQDPNLVEFKLAAASVVRTTLRTPYVHRVIVTDWSCERV